MSFPDLLTIDALKMTRNLPDELIKAIPVLMVNRQGDTCDAYMRTENFIGHVAPEKTYQVSFSGFNEAMDQEAKPLPTPTMPPHCVLTGVWQESVDLVIKDANILGGNGRYTLAEGAESLVVPVAEATPTHLAYYGCHLLAVGDATSFNTQHNLPVTITSIGKDYAEGYLQKAEKGGGAYLEVHDRPHFHMPLEDSAGGYLIIGKQASDHTRYISAFQIPFGYAVHMPPWAIHCDGYLIGRYMVVYSATSEFSTVIVRKIDSSPAPITFC